MMQATVLDRSTTGDGGAIGAGLSTMSAERDQADVSLLVAPSRRHELATHWYRTDDGRLEARWLVTPSSAAVFA